MYVLLVTHAISLSHRSRTVLPDMVKSVATLRFKNVSTTWGMTAESDPRLTNLSFGHFKSPVRQTGEKMLIQYMCDFSQSREARFKTDFDIALAVAAPGTGKTRTIDDMLRVRLPPNKFQCILRLGFSFNGFGDASCRFEVGSRAVREFFCGPAIERDSEILRAIDERIVQFFIAADPNDSFSDFRRETSAARCGRDAVCACTRPRVA
jgi:hypothetical protein